MLSLIGLYIDSATAIRWFWCVGVEESTLGSPSYVVICYIVVLNIASGVTLLSLNEIVHNIPVRVSSFEFDYLVLTVALSYTCQVCRQLNLMWLRRGKGESIFFLSFWLVSWWYNNSNSRKNLGEKVIYSTTSYRGWKERMSIIVLLLLLHPDTTLIITGSNLVYR